MAVRFGLFEFDERTQTLSREGTPVRLQPQPARVLAALLARPGEVITREELRATVWDEATHVDFDRGLNFCVAQIRTALADSSESPRFIETLPRRGYRFIAPVRDVPGDVPPVPAPARRRRRVAVAAAAAAAVVLGLSAVFFAGRAGHPPVRVAVVPFDNETGSGEFDRIAGGVADATVARLAAADRVERVAVIGNAAALRRPRAFRDLEAIGRELEAEYVVLAQVKAEDGRVRLIAHLIRTSDQAHVWAQTFDRPQFTLDVQAEIAETIARAVVQRVAG